MAYEEMRASAGIFRRLGAVSARLALPVGLMAIVAVGLEWLRFGMRTPSLVDDWFSITYSGPAVHALLHGDYGSTPVDAVGRYRPAYTAVWNYAQWHLLGSPSLAVAAVWGALRAALLLLAIWLLARWVLGKESRVPGPLPWLAPVAIALTPAFAVDLARHGPADPMMIAGLIVGLTLVGIGVRRLLDPASGTRTIAVAAIAGGYLLYLMGVYSKEASICVLAFVPFFVKWLGPDLGARLRASRIGPYALGGIAVLLIAPLVHITAHVARAISAGDDPYPNAKFDLGRKVLAAAVFPLIGAPGPLGTLLWLAGVPAAIALTVIAIRRRDRDAWLLGGVLTTGFLMSAFSLVRGDTPSRYYMPWVIAVAVVVVRALAATNVGLQIAAALVVLGVALTGTRDALADWARTEASGSTAVEMAKGVTDARCSAYLANFDVERRDAIPRLLPFARPERVPQCTQAETRVYAVSWKAAPLPRELGARCRPGWLRVAVRDEVALYRCESFAAGGILDQDAASGLPLLDFVRLRVPQRQPNPETFNQSGGAHH